MLYNNGFRPWGRNYETGCQIQLGLCVCVRDWISGGRHMAHYFLHQASTDEVIENARLMLETALSMRSYTTE